MQLNTYVTKSAQTLIHTIVDSVHDYKVCGIYADDRSQIEPIRPSSLSFRHTHMYNNNCQVYLCAPKMITFTHEITDIYYRVFFRFIEKTTKTSFAYEITVIYKRVD